MQRQAVNSSNLRSVGYDQSDKILEIEFHSGGVYRYDNVPHSVFQDLMDAPSHGKYFHAHIKGVYPYTKLR
jgi:hypothetical protein